VRGWYRRLRGFVGTALTWGAAWAIPGLLVGVPAWILAGLISGAGFSVVLAIAERHRQLEELTLKRVASLGAIGSAISALMAMPLYWFVSEGRLQVLPFLGVVAVLGAGSAAGTLALARRALVGQVLDAGGAPS
jgi:hypothetical protein